ncbi:MAG: extracellular solute-binding protein [Candidatus Dormibacteraeota bacterium]|uniref:Extracellular solute-binding protein n=1 Tax=Candidatus Amunia macphersoniae TaxID=3127014 RepID=A0A934KMJ3_9BACT|nr:extracellular solute-binding protein [Candidatus Dormibacteraeota bacterium]
MQTRDQRRALGVLTTAAVLTLSACGSSSTSSSSPAGGGTPQAIGGNVSVWAVWSGTEQKDFQAVLADFNTKTGVTGQFQSKGDQLPTVLGTAIAGGAPPDVAILPQPGLLHDLVKKNALKPIDSVVGDILTSQYAPVWKNLATDSGKTYGVYFKTANKSTVWYNVKSFTDAGITKPPATFDQLLTDMSTLQQSGVTPFAMCGGSGWTLTDWFENVYLRVAGVDKYNQLAAHTIPWTDPTVTTTFQTLSKIFGTDANMVGGKAGAVSTPFPDCVSQAFGSTPKAAMLYEADFVAGVIPTVNSGLAAGTGFNFFPFPSINGSPAAVSAGGDVAVMLKDTPQSEALMKYLASPDAGSIWAHLGGFTSPNKQVNQSVYPDDISRAAAKALVDAGNNAVFDMSDQAPAAFGGTAGSGEWADLQNWVRNTSDIAGTEAKLEADAVAAYGH